MKLLFSILSLFLMNEECQSTKNSTSPTDKNKIEEAQNLNTQKVQNDNMVISYSAFTRGTNKKITISKSEIILEDSRAKTPKQVFPCSEKDWNTIKTLVSKLDAKNLENLKAPSTKSYSDAALAANLKIVMPDKTFSTQDFDHGNPPDKIAALVNKLLSFVEKR